MVLFLLLAATFSMVARLTSLWPAHSRSRRRKPRSSRWCARQTPRPTPANFNLGRSEVRIVPDRERAAYRLKSYGEVLVVTDDYAERDTVIGFGGMAASCGTFIAQIQDALEGLQLDLKNHNQRERSRFKNRSRV